MGEVIGVRYNTSDMQKIANDMRISVSEFQRTSVAKFFNEMEKQVGLNESHATWNGEQAEDFMQKTVRPRKTDINNVCRNVISYATNLASQAKTWDNFENNQ